MMQATSQNKLLRTLGRSDRTRVTPRQSWKVVSDFWNTREKRVSLRSWSLAPAALAALIAGPALTAVGTCVAVALGAPIGEAYGLGAGAASSSWFADAARDALMPPLRLSRHAGLGANLVELATWPLAHNLVKSSAYIAIVIAVAELVSRRPLTPRQVPNAITASVVSAGLAIILADWAFSQLLLLRSS